MRFTLIWRNLMTDNRPHIVLIVDESGSMDVPSPELWRDAFNEIVDSVRYFSNTPLVTVATFEFNTKIRALKVPADHMPRFDQSNYSPTGGTAGFGSLTTVLAHLKGDLSRPTQVILITDGGFGDQLSPTGKKLVKAARKAKWGFAFVGTIPGEMDNILSETEGQPGDLVYMKATPSSIKALGLLGSEALEKWMKSAAIGKPAPFGFFGSRNVTI